MIANFPELPPFVPPGEYFEFFEDAPIYFERRNALRVCLGKGGALVIQVSSAELMHPGCQELRDARSAGLWDVVEGFSFVNARGDRDRVQHAKVYLSYRVADLRARLKASVVADPLFSPGGPGLVLFKSSMKNHSPKGHIVFEIGIE